MVMVVLKSTTHTEALQVITTNELARVRQTIMLHTDQCTDNIVRAHGTTDGTSDEMDFATRLRTAKHGPHHNAATSDHTQTDSAAMVEPMPAFRPGHDGHHSQVMPDSSYRSGPSVESGSS